MNHGALHTPVDTEGSTVPVDPLAALEKTTDAQNHMKNVQIPRLDSLQTISDQYNADPYTLSTKVRKRFREEKKIELQKEKADDQIKGRYGLPATLRLLEDDEQAKQEAQKAWLEAKQEQQRLDRSKRRKLAVDIVSMPSSIKPKSTPSSSGTASTNTLSSLRARILENTARKSSAFGRSSMGKG